MQCGMLRANLTHGLRPTVIGKASAHPDMGCLLGNGMGARARPPAIRNRGIVFGRKRDDTLPATVSLVGCIDAKNPGEAP